MAKFNLNFKRPLQHFRRGFSMVELMVVVVIIGIISGASFVGISEVKRKASNEKMLDDLLFIANALEEYRLDHDGKLPMPSPKNTPVNQNILCFYKDATYAHDCDKAEFVQGMIDESLMTNRYLKQIPTDPRTKSRYTYGVSKDRQFFQVAGVFDSGTSGYQARMAGNLAKGYPLPSIIRAYNGPNFVINGENDLPYNPDHLSLTGTLQGISGDVRVDGVPQKNGFPVQTGNVIQTDTNGKAELYFSDGSITQISANTQLELGKMEMTENNKRNIASTVMVKLKAGKIWNKVTRLASGSEFKVESTGAIAGVRGTEFGVTADINGVQKIEVLSGTVDVFGSLAAKTPMVILSDLQKTGFSSGKSNGANPLSSGEVNIIINDYYKEIPLHTGVEPYVISAKGDATTLGNLVVRNANHYVNQVNVNQPNRAGRRTMVNRLAAYDDLGNFLMGTGDISSELKANYELKGLPLNTPLRLRFEQCNKLPSANTKCSLIERKSAFSSIKIEFDAQTNLTDENLYPNLFNVKTTGPSLSVKAPAMVAENEKTFTLAGTINQLPSSTKVKTINVGLNAAANACTLAGNTPSITVPAANPFSTTINTKGTGDCDLAIKVELDDGSIFTDRSLISVVKRGQVLFLKQPANQSAFDKKQVTLMWEAPNAPSRSTFNVELKGPVTESHKNYVGKTLTTKMLTPGKYTWEVSIVDGTKVIETQSSTFKIITPLLLDFDVNDLTRKQKGKFINDEWKIETFPQKLNFEVEIKNPPTGVDFEWGGSVPAVLPGKVNKNKAFFEIEASSLSAPNANVFVKLYLTARDQNKNILGTRIKRINVSHVPPITGLAFAGKISVSPGDKATIPSLVINPVNNVNKGGTATLGGGTTLKGVGTSGGTIKPIQITLKPSDCPDLKVIGSDGTLDKVKGIYEAKTTASTTKTDEITCTIKKDTKTTGFKAYSDFTAKLKVAIVPKLSPLQIACNKIPGGVFDNGGCWLMAKVNDSCDVACSAASLSCKDSSDVGGSDWDDDSANRICMAVANKLGVKTTVGGASLFPFSPFYENRRGICYSRDISVKSSNFDDPKTSNTESLCSTKRDLTKNVNKICRCE